METEYKPPTPLYFEAVKPEKTVIAWVSVNPGAMGRLEWTAG